MHMSMYLRAWIQGAVNTPIPESKLRTKLTGSPQDLLEMMPNFA